MNCFYRFVRPLTLGAVFFLTQTHGRPAEPDDLKVGFASPTPRDAPETWWDWVDGNMSKKGITADLEAMKRVGMGGATIVSLSAGVPQGPVKFMSPEWFALVHHASLEANRLGLQLGMSNGPGWSSSGGPWITPEYAMQRVETSQLNVTGPTQFSDTLPTPPTALGYYRDIAVLAFPTLPSEKQDAQRTPSAITSSTAGFDGSQLGGGVGRSSPVLTGPTAGAPQYIQFQFSQPTEVRSIRLVVAADHSCSGEIQVSDDGQMFRTLRPFSVSDDLKIKEGSQFPIETTSVRYYRLVFKDSRSIYGQPAIPVIAVQFGATAAVDDLAEKSDLVRGEDLPGASSVMLPPGMAVDPATEIDLTSDLDGSGRLTWSVPPGDWTILRLGYTPTGMTNHPAPEGGSGLECDKLRRAAARIHWEGMLGKAIQNVGPKALSHTLIDSYEIGSQNWTPAFREEFRKRRGYDLLPYLPVLTGRFVGSPEITDRFLWDFRRTIADLFAENYYDYMAEMARDAGMEICVEPYGDGPFDYMRSGGKTDIVMGEFWAPQPHPETIKLAAEIAHIYGRPIVGSESFTSNAGNYSESPASLRPMADFAFTCGVNHMFFHRYAQQPWSSSLLPGMTMGPFGTNLDRTNTWWEQSGPWFKYLTRCQNLLRQGHFVADVVYLASEKVPAGILIPGDLPAGADYDVCNTDVLLHRMSVQDGRLVLPDGMSYRVMELPSDDQEMTPAVLEKLKGLVEAGATIIGKRPVRSPSLSDYPQCDDEVKRLTEDLWGGKKIDDSKSLTQVFADLKLTPDFEPSDKSQVLRYIHRATADRDIYFVSNVRNSTVQVDGIFRVTGKIPQLWHADSGNVESVGAYWEENGRTHVPLRLDPRASTFVVFTKAKMEPEHALTLSRMDAAPPAKFTSDFRLDHAIFGAGAGGGSMDVTGQIKAMMQSGKWSLAVNSGTFGKDPAPNQTKQLRLDYTRGGRPDTTTFDENDFLDLQALADPSPLAGFPDAQLTVAPDGRLKMEAWEAGNYVVKIAGGKIIELQATGVPPATEITGPWNLRFQPNWGAPDEITMDPLVSWTARPESGVKYYSGTATYDKTFQIPQAMLAPGQHLYLDLGRVKVLARVKLNGKDLGVLWKLPYRVEITDSAKVGDNLLEIQVTNLWVNRLIGDEQLPPIADWVVDPWAAGSHLKQWPDWFLKKQPIPNGRFTFSTWKHWNKDDPLVDSGLLGPVVLKATIDLFPH